MGGPQRLSDAGNVFDMIGGGWMGKNLLANAGPELLAEIRRAADAGDTVALRRILAAASDSMTTNPKPRGMPYDLPAASGRDPIPVGERLAQDPNITETVRQGFGPIADIPGMRLDAYGRMADAGGAEELLNLLGRSAPPSQFSVTDLLPDNNPLFSVNTGAGAGGGSVMDVLPGAGIPSPGGGLIAQGGRGVPVGGPTGSGVAVPQSTALSTQVTPRPALPGRGPRRLETTAGVPQGAVEPRQATAADATTRPAPRLESPDVVAERRAMEDLEDAVNADRAGRSGGGQPPGRTPGRNATPGGSPRRRNLLPAAAAAAGGAAAWRLGMDLMFPPGDRRETLGDGEMSTADLAAEASPPPSVMPEEPAPLSPREQAHALQRKLNEMRAAAGGEVPEAPAMRREIQRLFDLSDAQANAASRAGRVDPAPANNPLQQARSILAALNSGAVPANQRARMQAEMQRLYRLADEQANARTAAPRRAG